MMMTLTAEEDKKARKLKLMAAIQLAVQEKGFEARRQAERLRNPELADFDHDQDLQECINLLLTERHGPCRIQNCRCMVDFAICSQFTHVRPPAPVREILTHKLYKGEVWLYCHLDTAKAVPEYRRQCQLDLEMVRDYRSKLVKEGRSAKTETVWTMKDELRVRKAVFDKLDPKQELINQQLGQCKDTVEWDKLTDNMKNLQGIRLESRKKSAKPGPIEDGEDKVYVVEAMLGASLNLGKVWCLVKWEGWESKYNSWEPESAFKDKTMMTAFFNKFGKPTWKAPEILSPEGEEHMKWIRALEQKKKDAEAAEKTKAALALPPPPLPGRGDLTPARKKKKTGQSSHGAGSSRPGPDPEHEEELYEVERVIGAKLRGGRVFYYVKWVGWEPEFNSWEPSAGVQLAKVAIKDFVAEHGKPSVERAKILSPEGVESEALQQRAAAVAAAS
ncbi:hypothetical protein BV898_06228 [Hypsibius exemplaris]|uniref:Chromo domain-containing protein n=1 Tax=Hypsibius exemplaris TaxID=2072580 RepID=A0A1W0WWZ8_HYPEX|nr:hypothetical protein BV898_06228 [Hypsibius exemplaris]